MVRRIFGCELVCRGDAEVDQPPSQQSVDSDTGFEQSVVRGGKGYGSIRRCVVQVEDPGAIDDLLSVEHTPQGVELEEWMRLRDILFPEAPARGVAYAGEGEYVGHKVVRAYGEESVVEIVSSATCTADIELPRYRSFTEDESALGKERQFAVGVLEFDFVAVLRQKPEILQ